VIFRPGKFQKGVQVAEATTNCVHNPRFKNGTTGWSQIGNHSYARQTSGGYLGNECLRVTSTGGGLSGNNVTIASTGLTTIVSTEYTVSYWMRSISGETTIHVEFYGGGGLTTHEITTEWVRYQTTGTIDAGGNDAFYFWTVGAAGVFEIDAAQCEQKAYVTPYCDGTLGAIVNGSWVEGATSTHNWGNGAHASTSSRTAATISYSQTGNFNSQEGTVLMWVDTSCWVASTFYGLLSIGDTAAHNAGDGIRLYQETNGLMVMRWNRDGSVDYDQITKAFSSFDGWHLIAVKWDSSVIGISIDGSTWATASQDGQPPTWGSLIYLYGTSGYPNAIIDELVIVDNALDEDEVRAIYESEAPVFAETSTFEFSAGPSQLVWADHEGLWARDTAGEAALGLFCGEGTKSWGGFTMGPADLVLGANVSGSAAIHWDQSTGKFGFYGDGNATVQVEISTDGSLLAGAGNVALDADGIKIEVSGFETWARGYKFDDGSGNTIGGVMGLTNDSTEGNTAILFADDTLTDRRSRAIVRSWAAVNQWSNVQLSAYCDYGGGSSNHILISGWVTNSGTGSYFEYTADEHRFTGDVGIGTTPDNTLHAATTAAIVANDTILYPLKIEAKDDVGGFWTRQGVGIQFENTASSGAFISAEIVGRVSAQDGADGELLLRTRNSGTLGTRVAIDKVGNVGIDQGADDGDILTFASTDVGHGMTALMASSAYGTFSKTQATSGGLTIIGAKDADGVAGQALQLVSALGETAADTTKSAAAIGVIHAASWIKDGTSIKVCGTNENLFVMANGTSSKFVFDAEGEMHSDAIIGVGDDWDDWDDLALAADLSRLPKAKFNEMLKYHAEDFERAGLVTLSRDENGLQHAFMRHKAILQFTMCCLGEVHHKLQRYEKAFRILGINPSLV
jgi:hypothetical protein